MPRFFVSPDRIGSGQITVEGPDVNHMINVLRMAEGDELTVSDGQGMDYFCRISRKEKDTILLDIVDRWRSFSELPVRLVLFQGLPKADKMDLIVQKAVELGVYRVVPVVTERTVVRLDDKKAARRTARWQAISESAAKQAGRAIVPEVSAPVTFDEALKMCRGMDAFLMPYEKAEGMAAARACVAGLSGCRSVGVMIGPEGGFSGEEAAKAKAEGASLISLGRRILRTETAGLTMLSILMFALEKDETND